MQHTSAQFRRVALLVVAAIAIAACGDSGGEASPGTTASGGAAPTTTAAVPDVCNAERVGGAITMGVFSQSQGLDPAVASGGGQVGGTELSAIYDTLMTWNPKSGEYEPRLAESLTPDATFTEWTLVLRRNVRFGNGDAFTTAAVAANFERHKDPATKSPHRVLALLIASTTITDDVRMTIRLTQPWAEMPYLLSAQNLGMVPNPKVITALGADQFNRAPVGAGVGPYEVVKFVPGEGITMKAKTDYWNGPVCIQDLKFVALPGADATYDALKTGTINVGIIDDAQTLQRVRSDGANHASQVLNGQGLLINNGVGTSVTPFKNVNLRKAVLAAMDPTALDQRITQGTGDVTTSLFSKKSVYASSSAGPTYDAARATSLVAGVKAQDAAAGKVRLVCTQAQSTQAIAVKTALDSVGFEVQLQTVATTTDLIRVVVTEANFDLACWSMQVFDAGAWVKLDRFLNSKSTSNRSGYANADMDAALSELRLANGTEARKKVIAKMQTIWNDTAPSAIIRAGEPSVIWAKNVRGLSFNGEIMAFFDKAYLSK